MLDDVRDKNQKKWETLPDELLVGKILEKGNSKIFEIIYDRYANKVFNKCMSFTRNMEEAKDYTHDILVKAYLHLTSFKGQSKFSTWLFSITYNYCVDKQKRSKKKSDQLEAYFLEEKGQNAKIKSEDIFQIQLNRLMAIMEDLSNDEKMILLMKYQDDMSIKEIGNIINANESAVKMRLKRSREKLLQLYKFKYAHNVL